MGVVHETLIKCKCGSASPLLQCLPLIGAKNNQSHSSALQMMASAYLSSSSIALPKSRVSKLGYSLQNSLSSHLEIARFPSLFYGSLAADRRRQRCEIPGNAYRSSINSADTLGSSSTTSDQDEDTVPLPIVLIDQDSDPNATIVQLSFGDRLGALIDTMRALKDLGLDVTKGTVNAGDSTTQTEFFITRLGRKVDDPNMLERIRLTIINNLLKYHPESSEKLAMGEAFGIKPPEKKLDVDIATHILVKDDGPKRSLLCIEAADRPGLLLEIIKILADINVNVESAEIDTEGLVAKDKFHVSYRGAALNDSLSQVLVNCLRYYLRRPGTDEDSY